MGARRAQRRVSNKRADAKDLKLYDKVTAEAKRKFVWPSIPASSWVVREYEERGGTYKGEEPKKGGLDEWFDEQWVDISRPKSGGGFEPCMRDEKKGRYPKCLPKLPGRGKGKIHLRAKPR